jgi:enoyl-CoA hydratase/carnithine racemase
MSDRVKITIKDHIADVVLNRADKLNALDQEMFQALADAADAIAIDSSVRAVVLHGAGGNFCAGIDVSALGASQFDFADALATPLSPSPANFFQRAAIAWRELRVPVICALEGIVYGGGMQIALGADIRFASPDAKLSIMESKWGLIPDMGLTVTLRGLVSPDRVKELAWTARVLDSTEAQSLGLVTAVSTDALAASFELAAECAARSPDAIRGIKALVNQAWPLPDADALALEAELQSRIIGRANQIEAVQANLGRRQAEFKD